jgi:hypothetical protein
MSQGWPETNAIQTISNINLLICDYFFCKSVLYSSNIAFVKGGGYATE